MAVFVSDLVLLQALWAVFTWGTMWWMQRHDPKGVMYCYGCVDEEGSDGRRGTRRRFGRSLTGLTEVDRKSTRLNSSHKDTSRMPSSA